MKQIYLNENYYIKSLKSQDGELDFIFDKSGDRPPFDFVSSLSGPFTIWQAIAGDWET